MSDLNLTSAGFFFDRAFVSHKWKSGFVLKTGLRVPNSLLGKVMENEGLGIQVLHFEIEKTPYMLIGIDMTRGEFREAARSWITSSDASVKFAWLLPQAHAVSCMTATKNPFSGSTVMAFETDGILKAIGKCGTDALSGFTGSVSSTLNFFKRLATEPQKLWAETKQSFVELKDFVLNIHTELNETLAALQSLPAEEKAEIACVFAGQALGTVAQALTGAGAIAGLVKAFPSLLLKIKSAAKIIAEAMRLRQKGLPIPNSSFLAREAMSCAL